MNLAVVSETLAKELVSLDDAIAVTAEAFRSLHAGRSLLFPATRGHGSDLGTRFGVKAGYDGERRIPGLKVGSYWPNNPARGEQAHGSTTLLLDDDTGLPRALIAATHLTALRTAASDALAVRQLSRADASVLTVVGSGHQAYWDVLAVARVRRLSQVFVCARDVDGAERLAARLRSADLPALAATFESALPASDIVSTVTAARTPLFDADLIRPGTHISAMGADGPGKQELDPALFARASLWADWPPQGFEIGELQHLSPASRDQVRSIGAHLAGEIAGRSDDREITVYDSSGVAIQDLAICAFALERALASGRAFDLSFG